MSDIVIVAHGYTQTPRSGFRPWKDVVTDRIKKIQQLSKFFEELGVDTKIIISGGTVTDGKNEADEMYRFAKEKMPNFSRLDVELEHGATSIKDTVKNLAYLKNTGVKGIFPVSNKDNVSRIVRDWKYEWGDDKTIIGVVPSDEPYSIRGNEIQPLIAEPPFWGIDALQKIYDVPADKRDSVAYGIQKIIEDSLK